MNHQLLSCMFAAAAFSASEVDGALLFYEDFTGFTGAGASLNGQGGWNSPSDTLRVRNSTFTDGSSGTWDGTIAGSVTSGGNFITPNTGGAQGFADITLDSFVTTSFADGTSTWLSYVEYNGNNGSNGRQNIAITASALTALDATSHGGDGIGVASTTNNTPRAAYWDAGTGENADGSSGIGSGRPIFVMARIDWSDSGNDTITVKRFAFSVPGGLTEADWNAVTEVSTISADLDQSTFDTLSIASRYAWFDELRIANDFDSAVTGTVVVPEPTSSILIGLSGVLLILRRRK